MSHRRRAAGARRSMPGLFLLVVGVLIAVGAPALWSVTHQDPALRPIHGGIAVQLADAPVSGASSPVVRSSATSDRTPSSPPDPVVHVSPGFERETTTVPTATSRSAPRTTPARASAPVTRATRIPVRLSIPAIGINAAVAAVGVDDNGDMAVPAQVQTIGWYRFGAAPGDTSGSVVMSGHVDSAQQGLGAFARLGELKAGDAITVSDASGHGLRYRVVGREAFDKKTAPMSALFSVRGKARLTLITCGGDFDSSIRSYVENIVVTAVPQ